MSDLPPPPKKGMNGWALALLITGGFVLFFCALGGAGLFAFTRSGTGKKLVEAFSEGKKAYEDGRVAPGAAEIRAAGCHEALVLDTGKVLGIMRKFVDAGHEDGRSKVIVCQGRFTDDMPSCRHVAAAYLTAFPGGAAPEPFVVTVQKTGDSRSKCEEIYSETGEPIRTHR